VLAIRLYMKGRNASKQRVGGGEYEAAAKLEGTESLL
jgi:hypothetical protein